MPPRTAMEVELLKRGYRCSERTKFDSDETKWKKPPRFTYSNGAFRVLTESQDQPWWTVQKMSGSHVVWFVDFPLNVDIGAVFAFIESGI